MRDGGFRSCKADNDVGMRAATKKDGSKYWAYVLFYSDDIQVITETTLTQSWMALALRYTLKEGSVKEPTVYLGAESGNTCIRDNQ